MTYTPFDSPDAPPLDDYHAPTPGVPSPDATAIAIALNRIAAALERLSLSPGGPQQQVQSPPPGTPTGPPVAPPGGTSNETQVKRGKAIYAKCMNQNPPADIKTIGEHVTGHEMHWNSQKWTEADQVAVLDAMKTWGWT
jgi:hypothetical protein